MCSLFMCTQAHRLKLKQGGKEEKILKPNVSFLRIRKGKKKIERRNDGRMAENYSTKTETQISLSIYCRYNAIQYNTK